MLCVERVGHKNGVRNAYVARQERIEGQLPVHTGTRFGDIEVSDLRFGVNARVGPSCTVHMDALAEHVSHGVLNDVLNGGQGGGVFAGLRLPAVILGAYVGYRQLEAGHGRPLGKTKKRRKPRPPIRENGGADSTVSGPVRSGAFAPLRDYLERCSLPVMLKARA